MKILTLNTHSLVEENYIRKLVCFVEHVILENPDLIALQEVNQSANAAAADADMLQGQAETFGEIPIKADNHAAWIAFLLEQTGISVSWVWLPVKKGYGRFDEGLALLSLRGRIADTDVVQLSRGADYENWKTRKALGVRIEGAEDWFYTVHFGWWNDEEEPFSRQWEELRKRIAGRTDDGNLWLMGDFNSPAGMRGEGYDLITADHWQDAWLLAETTRGQYTVETEIDGWQDRAEIRPGKGLRVDHIWCRRSVPVRSAKVIFDGKHEPRVSDHCGILLETKV